MLSLLRTSSAHPDFIALVKLLDADLATRDGADHSFYAQFNKIDQLQTVIVAYNDKEAIGCGAFKPFEADKVEIKRMYVKEEARNKKVASQVLSALELWAKELGYFTYILETGIRQPEAIALYHKMGYHIIPNYAQYADVSTSVCFQKENTPI
ncbi:MAG: GNAT family N-acetyltransferase [Bacteroidota bacterium]